MNVQFQQPSLAANLESEYTVEFNPQPLSVELDSTYVEIPEYTGSYYVTPTPYQNVLATKGKKMTQNVTVNAAHPFYLTATATLQTASRSITFSVNPINLPISVWFLRFNGQFPLPTSSANTYRILEARSASNLRVMVFYRVSGAERIYTLTSGIRVTEQTYNKFTLQSNSASEAISPGFFNPGAYELIYFQ